MDFLFKLLEGAEPFGILIVFIIGVTGWKTIEWLGRQWNMTKVEKIAEIAGRLENLEVSTKRHDNRIQALEHNYTVIYDRLKHIDFKVEKLDELPKMIAVLNTEIKYLRRLRVGDVYPHIDRPLND